MSYEFNLFSKGDFCWLIFHLKSTELSHNNIYFYTYIERSAQTDSWNRRLSNLRPFKYYLNDLKSNWLIHTDQALFHVTFLGAPLKK